MTARFSATGWGAAAAVITMSVLAGVATAAPRKKPTPVAPPAAAAATPSAPTPVPAPDPRRRMVGILDVRVEGLPSEIQLEFERGLEQQLDTNTYWLSSREQMRERMRFSTRWAEGCLVGDCLAEVRTQTSADLVLLAALNGEGTSFGYVITLVRTDTGRVLAQESSRCEVCTVKEAMTEATLATIRLLNNVPDKLPDQASDQAAIVDMAVGKLVRHLRTQERGWRNRGIALTVTGLVIAAGGAALYVLADRPAYALGLATAGGGLAAGGIVVLSF